MLPGLYVYCDVLIAEETGKTARVLFFAANDIISALKLFPIQMFYDGELKTLFDNSLIALSFLEWKAITFSDHISYRWYLAKRAQPAMLTHGR